MIQDEGICMTKIGATKDRFWILGVVFLQGLYQVYDMSRNSMSLVPYGYRHYLNLCRNTYAQDLYKGNDFVKDLGDEKVTIIVSIVLILAAVYSMQIRSFRERTVKEEGEIGFQQEA